MNKDEEEILGKDHLLSLISRSNIAFALSKQKKIKEAVKYGLILLEDMRKNLGETHENTLVVKNLIAFNLEDLGKISQAQGAYINLIADYDSLNPIPIMQKAQVQNNLAMLYYTNKKYKKANELFKKTIGNIEKNGNMESFDYVNLRSNYAWLLNDMKQFSQAKKHAEYAYNKFLKYTGEESNYTKKAKKLLQKLEAQ